MENSEIQSFFKDQTIFITGGTGLLGKLIIEKLLRSCWDLKKIIVLVRPKNGKSLEERFREIFELPCFHNIKNQNIQNKVIFIKGDCNESSLGLSDTDVKILKEETTCIFHGADKVKFDLTLKESSYHVKATRDVLELAKQMKNLKVFVYMSSVSSLLAHPEGEEKLYQPPIKGDALLSLIDTTDDAILQKITPSLVGDWVIAYGFTKCVTENFIKDAGLLIPSAVIRPALVASASTEPLKGWIDVSLGLVAIIKGILMGVIRTMHMSSDNGIYVVPADHIVNFTLAVAWKTSKNNSSTTTVYNCIGEYITYGKIIEYVKLFYWKFPSLKYLWYMSITFRSKFWHRAWTLFYTLVLHLLDFIACYFGRRTNFAVMYKRLNNQLDPISKILTTYIFHYEVNNFHNLWEEMSSYDQKLFKFKADNICSYEYFRDLFLGIRLYLLKEPIETIPVARKRLQRFRIIHYLVVGSCYLLICLLFIFLFCM